MVDSIEVFREILDHANAGDAVGRLLRGVRLEDVERVMVVADPGAI